MDGHVTMIVGARAASMLRVRLMVRCRFLRDRKVRRERLGTGPEGNPVVSWSLSSSVWSRVDSRNTFNRSSPRSVEFREVNCWISSSVNGRCRVGVSPVDLMDTASLTLVRLTLFKEIADTERALPNLRGGCPLITDGVSELIVGWTVCHVDTAKSVRNQQLLKYMLSLQFKTLDNQISYFYTVYTIINWCICI